MTSKHWSYDHWSSLLCPCGSSGGWQRNACVTMWNCTHICMLRSHALHASLQISIESVPIRFWLHQSNTYRCLFYIDTTASPLLNPVLFVHWSISILIMTKTCRMVNDESNPNQGKHDAKPTQKAPRRASNVMCASHNAWRVAHDAYEKVPMAFQERTSSRPMKAHQGPTLHAWLKWRYPAITPKWST